MSGSSSSSGVETASGRAEDLGTRAIRGRSGMMMVEDEEEEQQREPLVVLSECRRNARSNSRDGAFARFPVSPSIISQEALSFPIQEPAGRWTDVPFLIAFVIQVVVVVYLALWYGAPHVTASTLAANAKGSFSGGLSSDDASLLMWLALAWSAGGAFSVAALRSLLVVQHWPLPLPVVPAWRGRAAVVVATQLSAPACLLCLAVPALLWTRTPLGYTAATAALIWGFLMLAFSVESLSSPLAPLLLPTLQTAGVAALGSRHDCRSNLLIAASLVLSLLSVGYVAVWSLALIGASELACPQLTASTHLGVVATSGREDHPHPGCPQSSWSRLPLHLSLYVSLFWTLQVLKNVAQVAAVRVVGSWWWHSQRCHRHPPSSTANGPIAFGDKDDGGRCSTPGDPTHGGIVSTALLDAATRRLGSICLASLVVPLVDALMPAATKKMSSSSHNLLLATGPPTICVGRQMARLQPLHGFALAEAALCHRSVLPAGRQVYQLFQRHGWTPATFDVPVFRVLWMCRIAVALCTGLTGMAVRCVVAFTTRHEQDNRASPGDLAPLAFLGGFGIGFVASHAVLSIAEGALRAAILCWVDDPDALAEIDERLHGLMAEEWSKTFPQRPDPPSMVRVINTKNSNA